MDAKSALSKHSKFLTRSRLSNNGKYQSQYHNRAHVCSEICMLYTLYQSKDIYTVIVVGRANGIAVWLYGKPDLSCISTRSSPTAMLLHVLQEVRGSKARTCPLPIDKMQARAAHWLGLGLRPTMDDNPLPGHHPVGECAAHRVCMGNSHFQFRPHICIPKTSVSCCIEIIAAALQLVE